MNIFSAVIVLCSHMENDAFALNWRFIFSHRNQWVASVIKCHCLALLLVSNFNYLALTSYLVSTFPLILPLFH